MKTHCSWDFGPYFDQDGLPPDWLSRWSGKEFTLPINAVSLYVFLKESGVDSLGEVLAKVAEGSSGSSGALKEGADGVPS